MRMCEDNIKMDVKGMYWEIVDYIHVTQSSDC